MTDRRFRWLGAGSATITGAAVLVLMPTVAPTVLADAALLAGEDALPASTALFVGGTFMPIPTPAYITANNDLYIHCDPPACSAQGLFYPAALYPATGVKSLTLDTSVAQGAANLDNAIGQQLAEGQDHVSVFGISQGATVESAAMENIVNGSAGIHPDPTQLSFVLAGDPNNPNGGLLDRFDLPPGSTPAMPSLGATFLPATPVTEYPTVIYDGEYDGFTDFPKYPINVLSDLNALLGVALVHGIYSTLTPDQLAPESPMNPGGAIEVPTSTGYTGDTAYYIIPTEHLPLLDPLRLIPGVGPLVSDLIGPDLRVLVNLGYGDPAYGWVNADANVPTPIGFLPSLADFEKVPGALVNGTEQGIQQLIGDLENPAQLFSPAESPLAGLLALLSQGGGQQALPEVLTELGFLPSTTPSGDLLSSVANALGGAASALYAGLLPIADTANALLTSLPAADASVFLNELAGGNFLDAIGLPIAADLVLVPLAVGLGAAGAGVQALIAAGDLINPFVNIQSVLVPLVDGLLGG